jgi:hypothetical protein
MCRGVVQAWWEHKWARRTTEEAVEEAVETPWHKTRTTGGCLAQSNLDAANRSFLAGCTGRGRGGGLAAAIAGAIISDGGPPPLSEQRKRADVARGCEAAGQEYPIGARAGSLKGGLCPAYTPGSIGTDKQPAVHCAPPAPKHRTPKT